MRFRAVVLASLTAGLLVAATHADAAVHYPTSIDATGTSVAPAPSEVFIEYGRVHSRKAACRAFRQMTMIGHRADGSTKVMDVTTSSRNGAYAMVADFTGIHGTVIKAARKRFGRKGHRLVCDAASVPAD